MKMRAKAAFAIALSVATLAVVAFLWPNRQSTSPSTQSANHPSIPSSALSPAEQDRALRAEQLQAAQKLAAEFPDNDDAIYLLGLGDEGYGLGVAITGLIHECTAACEPTLIQHWVDLIHNYVLRFARPLQHDDPLRLLWERVAAHLSEEWTLARLAREAGYSNEHLRRLCRGQLGRSPMHQVTYLRMRRAAELLARTSHTVEAIAQEVGYHNPFVFSNAFTKWIGWRPSEYRKKKLQDLRF